MTTITYRDGVLAADTSMSRGATMLDGITKVARGPDGRLGAACGRAAFMGAWLAWIEGKGEQPEPVREDDCSDAGVVVWPDGRVEMFEPYTGGEVQSLSLPEVADG